MAQRYRRGGEQGDKLIMPRQPEQAISEIEILGPDGKPFKSSSVRPHTVIDPKYLGEYHKRIPWTDEEAPRFRREAVRFYEDYDLWRIPRQAKEDGEIVTPIKGNACADRVLFMFTHAGDHVFARGIGSECGSEYRSRIIHGMMADGRYVFEDRSLFPDDVSREDPRATLFEDGRIYLTYTRIQDAKAGYSVGLASIKDPSRPHEITEHGSLIGVNEDGVDCKDATILPEKVGGKVWMLIRLKPGIQAVSFDDVGELVALAQDPGRRDAYWKKMREEYDRNPQEYNHLHPNTPQMRLWEARWSKILSVEVENLMFTHPQRDLYQPVDDGGYSWYGPGPAPIKVEGEDGRRYWLGFPHRGQVVSEPTEEGKRRMTEAGVRVDSLKFYCVLSTLHDFEDPRKLVAVSPSPVSMPKAWRYGQRADQSREVRELLNSPDAVRFVYIAAGAQRMMKDGEPHIYVPVGVDDSYTVPKFMKEKGPDGIVEWMLKYGRVD
jgi:hypothetical protein